MTSRLKPATQQIKQDFKDGKITASEYVKLINEKIKEVRK